MCFFCLCLHYLATPMYFFWWLPASPGTVRSSVRMPLPCSADNKVGNKPSCLWRGTVTVFRLEMEMLVKNLFWGWVSRRSRSPQVFLPRLKEPQAVTSIPLTLNSYFFCIFVFLKEPQAITASLQTLESKVTDCSGIKGHAISYRRGCFVFCIVLYLY